MKRGVRVLGWGVAVLALAAGVWWRDGREVSSAGVAVPCADILQGCALPGAGFRVRFDRAPMSMQLFHIWVDAPLAQRVAAQFRMQGMNMGPGRYLFVRAGHGSWEAEVLLPACLQGRRDWEMRLEVDGRHYRLPFTSGG